MQDKYQSQLRQLGKKVFQLRQAIETSSDGSVYKQGIAVTTAVRQALASLPSDGFMLAIHPDEKIYENPAVLPMEVLRYDQMKPVSNQDSITVDVNISRNEFFERMEQYSQTVVLGISIAADVESTTGSTTEKKLSEVPEKILTNLFSCRSIDRIKSNS